VYKFYVVPVGMVLERVSTTSCERPMWSAGRAAGRAGAGRNEALKNNGAGLRYLTTHNNSPNQTSQNKPTNATAPQTSKHFTIQATQLTQKSCQNVLTSQL
jgi:hypothetical protein